MAERATEVVDVVFAVAGTALPEDYHFALLHEVARCLPWLAADPEAGIHPLRGAPTDYGVMLLPRRTKLVLRLPAKRVPDAQALAGHELEVEGRKLSVGTSSVRALEPYGALYAHLVAGDGAEEGIFLEGIAARLAALRAPCEPVCGRRRSVRAGEREIVGFSLMLHDLTAEHSLRIQRSGIGEERKLGCGIFVPHRLASAVGSA
ncbi:MAG TPA: type I-MYXAN CRISPR-associated protein Cas6/Cmx6 [Casimicrobiaceae bacterium]|nr:type I-MYXAN CRISPR-associated protein Cas6/Cmx6 [Casimicrobiaceae bacterium]